MAVGQYTSNGPLSSWRMVPIFKGIGLGMNLANAYITFFYNVLLGYAFYYMVQSFTSNLPWEKCNPAWASANCVDDYSKEVFTYLPCTENSTQFKCEQEGSVNFGQCFNLTSSFVGTSEICSTANSTLVESIGYWKTSFPSQDYWQKIILQQSESIDASGTLVWQLVVALLVSWIIVYLILFLGVKVSGKVVWFTATFPYLILVILGIRGWILPGADIGIRFYLVPNWSKLTETNVWIDAASQIFFSLSLSYGGISTLASYNKFSHNILRDSILIPLLNCLTSFFAGFVIFSYMGYLSFITGQDIGNIVQAGQGLAFVVYPYAVTTIAGAPFWAICFFFMIILLGIDSSIASVETTLASVFDTWPILKSTKLRKHLITILICLIYFAGGLLFCLQSGTYWLELVNTYAGDWAILIIGALEAIAVTWFYGFRNFKIDLSCMIGSKYVNNFTYYIWYFLWAIATPIFLLVLVGINFPNLSNIELDGYRFPDWSHILGECITASLILVVLLVAVYQVISIVCIKKQSFLTLFKPDLVNYRPLRDENYRKVLLARGSLYSDIGQTNLSFELEEPGVQKTSL